MPTLVVGMKRVIRGSNMPTTSVGMAPSRFVERFMPRFVILEHDHPRVRHYDFMLEMGETLKTWSLAEPPAIGLEQSAELLPDHRLAYLDYEGPVSDDRGTVKQWDKGTYRLIKQTDTSLTVELFGGEIRSQAILLAESKNSKQWKFHLEVCH